MALEIATVTNSIAALDVLGVTLKDVDEIPTAAKGLGPIIIPGGNFITDFVVERMSFGGGSTAKMNVSYTLTYRLLFAPVGAGRGFKGVIDVMVDKLALFLDAVLAIDTFGGGIDIEIVGVTNFGVVGDPADDDYFGCDIALRVLEFVN